MNVAPLAPAAPIATSAAVGAPIATSAAVGGAVAVCAAVVLLLVLSNGGGAGSGSGGAKRTYDVVVYGSTPSGVMAACAAAATGARVALVDSFAHVGGMMSGGLGATDMTHGDPYGSSPGYQKLLVGGMPLRFFTLMKTASPGAFAFVSTYLRSAGNQAWAGFAPHEAEAVFTSLLASNAVDVFLSTVPTAVTLVGKTIKSMSTTPYATALALGAAAPPNCTFSALVFVDATYEGDLIAMSGAAFALGREAQAVAAGGYAESLAGATTNRKGAEGANPYVTSGVAASGLLPMVLSSTWPVVGSASPLVQSYNFRMCFTQTAANGVPIPEPHNYVAARWELLRRNMPKKIAYFVAQNSYTVPRQALMFVYTQLANGKSDANSEGWGIVGSDMVGGSNGTEKDSYGAAIPAWCALAGAAAVAPRAAAYEAHRQYMLEYIHFGRNDPTVPTDVRAALQGLYLAADEFKDNGNWPYRLYVREGRRLLGAQVLTQAGSTSTATSISQYYYPFDCHDVNRISTGTDVGTEGGQAETFPPNPRVPYACLYPNAAGPTNLLACVAFSVSHIAYCGVRVEPTLMMVGQAAGCAAAIAVATAKVPATPIAARVDQVSPRAVQNAITTLCNAAGKVSYLDANGNVQSAAPTPF